MAEDARWFQEQFDVLKRHVQSAVLTRPGNDVVELALVCLLAEGHLLLDDVPGVGKTSLARAIASSIGGTTFGRIQFTPDMLPGDLTGSNIWNSHSETFEFHEGVLFNNIVIADEINRASPKTQAALLEVMEERQITVDGVTYKSPRPFIVIATQNPVEHEGTYRLPEAQIDRFMMRSTIGYPDVETEARIIAARASGVWATDLEPVMDLDTVGDMINVAADVQVAPSLNVYAAELADMTRAMHEVKLGVSPRGSIALIMAAKAFAASKGSHFCTADHIRKVLDRVFAHRMLLTADAELRDVQVDDLTARLRDEVPRPRAVPGES